MNAAAEAVLLVIWLPLMVVWIVVLVGIVRSTRLSTRGRVLWAIACTLVWPVMILYLLMRNPQGRAEIDERRTDRHQRLVDAVLDHEAGRIDDARMDAEIRALRGR